MYTQMTHIYLYICIYVHICIHIYLYICVYMCIYVYTHICIDVSIWRAVFQNALSTIPENGKFGIANATSIFRLALNAFWNRSLHIYICIYAYIYIWSDIWNHRVRQPPIIKISDLFLLLKMLNAYRAHMPQFKLDSIDSLAHPNKYQAWSSEITHFSNWRQCRLHTVTNRNLSWNDLTCC